MAGTFVDRDLGDMVFGGNLPPMGFRVDGTAQLYLYRHRLNLLSAGVALWASAAGSAIHVREGWPSTLAARAVAGATIDGWAE